MSLEAEGVATDQTFCKAECKGVIGAVFSCVQDGIFVLHLQSEDY